MYQYRLSFSEAIGRCFSKYCCFSGRAARSEYWWWYLFNLILSWICCVPYFVSYSSTGTPSVLGLCLLALVSLALLLPNLGVIVRRLHDIGKGGGWIFISLIPFIGAVWLLILLLQASQPGPNRFGEEPNMRPIGQ